MEEIEASWIAACKNGHRPSFEPLVKRYGPRAFRFAFALVRDAEEAKDLSQEAFGRAFVALARFDSARPFYPWFLTILRNLCLSHLRRRRATVDIDDLPEARDPAEPGIEVRMQVEQALGSLSTGDREILVLKAFQDLSYREISEVLEIPRGTVMSRLYHARRRLKDALR